MQAQAWRLIEQSHVERSGGVGIQLAQRKWREEQRPAAGAGKSLAPGPPIMLNALAGLASASVAQQQHRVAISAQRCGSMARIPQPLRAAWAFKPTHAFAQQAANLVRHRAQVFTQRPQRRIGL